MIGRDVFSQEVREKLMTQRELTARIHQHSFDLLLKDESQSKMDWERIKDQSQAGTLA